MNRLISYPKFQFDPSRLAEYKGFLEKYGFIHFKGFVPTHHIENMRNAIQEIEREWLGTGRKKMLGIPIVYGKGVDGRTIVQRFPFTSLCHTYFQSFYIKRKLCLIRQLLGKTFRVGEKENDGVVTNHYVNNESIKNTMKRMGWHTDSARDFARLRKLQPFYNVGIHLDDCYKENGGLRVLPGTHQQTFKEMLFRKMYFVSNKADKNEVVIEVNAGDLTIHDGRIWHRVAQSSFFGEKSRRRVIYFPFIRGEKRIRNETSKTPFYAKVLDFFRNPLG